MSEESAKPIFEQFKEELLGGTVIDIGVQFEARQPWLTLLVVEKDGKRYDIYLDSAPKINGGY